jgi:uncharacterized DUF497 family protein
MLAIRRLIWDSWNIAHIARHHVIPEEVEAVCHGAPMFSATYKGRLRVVGPTPTGRMLTVILGPTEEAGVYYPITARPADRKERRLYAQARGGT